MGWSCTTFVLTCNPLLLTPCQSYGPLCQTLHTPNMLLPQSLSKGSLLYLESSLALCPCLNITSQRGLFSEPCCKFQLLQFLTCYSAFFFIALVTIQFFFDSMYSGSFRHASPPSLWAMSLPSQLQLCCRQIDIQLNGW